MTMRGNNTQPDLLGVAQTGLLVRGRPSQHETIQRLTAWELPSEGEGTRELREGGGKNIGKGACMSGRYHSGA